MKFLVLLAFLLLALPVAAQTTVDVGVTWNAPTTGSPVRDYTLQLSIDGADGSEIRVVTEGGAYVRVLEMMVVGEDGAWKRAV